MISSPLTEIDSREIVERAKNRITNVSQGLLSNFTEHSPETAILEATVYVVIEYLAQLRLLPEATLINLLNSKGFTGSTGTKSVGTVNVTLTTTVESFSIPAGWRVKTADNKIFVTTTDLLILDGSTGNATVESEQNGADQNVLAGSITGVVPGEFTSGLILSISNVSPTTGGTDPQTNEQIIQSGFESIHQRGVLVTEEDYIIATRQVAPNSTVVVVPKLAPDKIQEEKGSVHLFILNEDSTTPSSAQLLDIKDSLNNKKLIGTELYVSPLEKLAVDISLVVESDGSASAPESVNTAIRDYVNPKSWQRGRALDFKDLEFIVRVLPEINYVTSAATGLVGDTPVVQILELPNIYTVPIVNKVTVTISSRFGVTVNEFTQ